MNLNQFTIKSQDAIQRAQQIAMQLGNQAIEAGHMMKGILETDQNVAPYIFKKLGVNAARIEETLDSILRSYPKISGGEIYLSKESNEVIQKAMLAIKEFKDEYVSIEHLLIGILKSKSAVSQMLKDSGIDEKTLLTAIKELRGGERVTSASQEDTYQSLDTYARNLNQLASDGKLDPVIGRDDEIRRVLQILSRRTKNNPILIGEPGVGKTAIAEGLAHRIIGGDIPENLKSKRIYSLDMGALIAGAKYKGEFEERLKRIVEEAQNDSAVIIVIDEIHT
ncbi:MAG TPA: type VI secretion system ATPase TssH, partial [Flavobacteriales bacterium]|nr:type VI secretion system ATPase TssH [Flavobacteriales bacterium]